MNQPESVPVAQNHQGIKFTNDVGANDAAKTSAA